MRSKKTLSIVIPAYNEAAIIWRCLDAIANQTVLPLEVIIADNNSTDDTAVIAKSYPFVRVVRVVRVKKQGILYARDAGFNAARGDIIARIDADTILPTDWVEHISTFYANPDNAETCITGGGSPHNMANAKAIAFVRKLFAFGVNRLLFGHNILSGSNMAIPRAVWNEVRHSTCVRTDIHEDLDLAVHVNRAGYQIFFDETLLVLFRVARMTDDLSGHWKNVNWWWRTFRVHGYTSWPIVYVLSVLCYLSAYPLRFLEWLSVKLRSQRYIEWRAID